MAPRTTSTLTSRPRHHPTATLAYIARLHITDAQDCCASSALLGTGADKTRHLARNSGDPAPPRPSTASRIRTAAQDRRLATQAASLLCCRRHRHHHSGLPSPTAPTPATPDTTHHSLLFPRVACSPALVTNGKLRGTPSPCVTRDSAALNRHRVGVIQSSLIFAPLASRKRPYLLRKHRTEHSALLFAD